MPCTSGSPTSSICIGPPPASESYLNPVAILTAATISNAEAVHPGYGFLSENADFAAMVEEHGITFIGPTPEHIRMMGDKIAAKRVCKQAGIPVVPGSDGPVANEDEARAVAETIGFPVMVKAAAGGGGRGMKVADSAAELAPAMARARAEALAAFGNGELYLEKYLLQPRHIEVQILADLYGTVVHLGERDCSLQRRHQKVLEEAPSPALEGKARARIGRLAAKAAVNLGYRSVGTFEFLYEGGEFYFIEMNTRLQVEHPVTEMVCGLDLVREMLRVAAGVPLGFGQSDIRFAGHAIECRINAENPDNLHALPRPRHRLPCARRARHTRRFGAVRRLYRATLLRQHDRQVGRARAGPQHLPDAPAARSRRVCDQRHRHQYPIAPTIAAGAGVHRRRLHHPLARTVRARQRLDAHREITG